jgi:hypothetical protein
MSDERGLSPPRVVVLSVLFAVGASVVATLAVRAALGDRAPARERAVRREPAAAGERGGAPADAGAIRELADSVARIERALQDEGVPLQGTRAARKDEILAGLLAITQRERQLAVREAFQKLSRCGDAVVPDIVALLKSGRDQDWGGGFSFGGNMFTGGYPRLRTVLIDVLRQIGTPAAKEGLLDALGGSEDLLDYRDLLLLYSGTTDEQMVRGISAMIPEMLESVRGGGEGADQVDRYVSDWITRHNPEGADDLLEQLALRALREGKPAGSALAALIDSSPERAFLLVSRRAEDKQQAIRQAATSLRMGRAGVSLSAAARFCELVWSKMDPDRTTRTWFYVSLPTRLDRSIASAAERAADGRVLLEFLERQQRTETDEGLRRMLEKTIDRLKGEIAKCE